MVVGSLPVIRQCASVRLLHRSDSWDKNIRRGMEITCKHPSQVNQWKYSFCKDAGIPCMADGAYVELDREGDAWLKLPSVLRSFCHCLPSPLFSLSLCPSSVHPSFSPSSVPRYLHPSPPSFPSEESWRLSDGAGWDGTASNHALFRSRGGR